VAATAFNSYFGVARSDFLATLDRISGTGSHIAIDPSLMLGAVPFEKWILLHPWKYRNDEFVARSSPCRSEDDVIIIKQANTSMTALPHIQGCKTAAETFTMVRFNLFGRALILIPKGYQYALFEENRTN
jgi:hypothetical protein